MAPIFLAYKFVYKTTKGIKFEKYFSIKVPIGDKLTVAEIVFLQPFVEKRLRELEQDWVNSCNAVKVLFDKRNELAITDAGKSLWNLKKLENEKEYAFSNLKEACEAAKYFKLVLEDCEFCKAVQ